MNSFLVVGYFTVGTPYEGEAEVLKLSLDAMGYKHDIQGVPNLGSWQKNTQFKAHFLRRMLHEHWRVPLLYIDVDAIVVQKLTVLDDIDCDIAAVHFAKGKTLCSGTVYFKNNPACRKLIDRWIKLNEMYPETLPDGRAAWDQRTLEMAIKEEKGIRFVELPQELCWITELTQKYAPGLSPVIIHTRGAKRFKNQINGKAGYAYD
jgi:hypothetical protein